MDAGLEDWRENPGRAMLNLARASVGAVVDVIRTVLFSVMALVDRFVMGGLSLAVVGLLTLSAAFWVINLAHPTHFPFGVVFWMVAGCGVLAIFWQLLLYWLPRSRAAGYACVAVVVVCVIVSMRDGAAHRPDSHFGRLVWITAAVVGVALLLLNWGLRIRRQR